MKMKNLITIIAATLLFTILGQAQVQITVPNEVRYTDGTKAFNTTTFRVVENRLVSKLCMWWDVEFVLLNKGAGSAHVKMADDKGNEEIVAGFSSDGNTVTYDYWHAGAYVFYPENFYDVFQTGRIIEFNGIRSRTLDVNFEMQPYSNFIWNKGNTRLIFEYTGSLEIIPSSTVTMSKPGMDCPEDGTPQCATICFRDNFWWANLNPKELGRYSVAQFGVNFGNEGAVTPAILQNIRRNNDNGAAAVFQLQFQRQQVPPQNAGWAECYGVSFEEFTVTEADRTSQVKVNTKTLLTEINRLLKASIKNYNATDFANLVKVARLMNDVRNCPPN